MRAIALLGRRQMLPLNASDAIGPVICDGFRLSMPSPAGDDLVRELRPLFDVCGVVESPLTAGLFLRGGAVVFKRGSYGGAIAVLSFTGGLCGLLRDRGLLEDVVCSCAGYPRNQTRTDVALDFAVHAPPILRAAYAAGRGGGLSLSRQRMPGDRVRWAMCVSAASGEDTGTVYLGKRGSADVCAAIYDKRQERVDKGADDPGPLLRVEVRVGKVGAVLGDVLNPERLFYHYAAPDLVRVPPAVGVWIPDAEGLAVQRRREFSALERLEHMVAESAEVGVILDLAHAAAADGEDWEDGAPLRLLQLLLLKRIRTRDRGLRTDQTIRAGGMGAERPMEAS
jgi:hypothetical protein